MIFSTSRLLFLRPSSLLSVGLLLSGALAGAGCTEEPTTPDRQLEPLVVAESPPPAIQGGTLATSFDGRFLAAADPDRDALWVVDLEEETLIKNIPLSPGDEPGRIEGDHQGGFVAVLRGSGEILRLKPGTFDVDYRTEVCDAPRGIDSSGDKLFVACAGGELLTLPLLGGEVLNRSVLDRDLRDVVATDGLLFVSQFRSAHVLVLEEDGTEITRHTPPDGELNRPGVAWRMIEHPRAEGVLLLHQRSRTTGNEPVVVDEPGGYGGGDAFTCNPSIVQAAITHVTRTGSGSVAILNDAVLPVDIAMPAAEFTLPALVDFVPPQQRGDEGFFGGGGDRGAPAPGIDPGGSGAFPVAVASAGSLNNNTTRALGVGVIRVANMVEEFRTENDFGTCTFEGVRYTDGRQIVSTVADPRGRLITQSRDPWQISIAQGRTIDLPGMDRKDSGHDLFHENTGGNIACASCHPGGGDDGQVWTFEGIGERRTQNISGGILGTEPFHWEGDMQDFSMLAHEVFTTRMGGPTLPPKYADAMATWIDTLPDRPRGTPVDVLMVERGRFLFESDEAQCVTCHSGGRLANNDHVDVGTGLMLQVPSLHGLSMRAPFMHNGCAETMAQRFDPACGGGDQHGVTSHLSETEIADMSAYLETL